MNYIYIIVIKTKDGDIVRKEIETNDTEIALDYAKVCLERHCGLVMVNSMELFKAEKVGYAMHLSDLVRDHNAQHTPF